MSALENALLRLSERITRLEQAAERSGGADGLPGPWTTFAPTLAQTAAVTATVSYARYLRIGKAALVQIQLVATGAGTAGGAVAVTSIPAVIAPFQTGSARTCGHARFVDVSTGISYQLDVEASTSTTLLLVNDGQTNYFGATPAITVASGDILALNCTYEVA